MFIIQRKNDDQWQTVMRDGQPVTLFEGQSIPCDHAEIRCIPIDMMEEFID